MKVLVTGHDGYIGVRLVPILQAAGHEVVGLDSGLFSDCLFGEPVPEIETIRTDIRDVTANQLEGFDAVCHLAGLSNDPLGDLDPTCTFSINHLGTAHLGEQAKAAGVSRFIFSSSCSLYGRHGDDILDEHASFNPVTPYGESKVLAEQSLEKLADENFTTTYLRNATAYGYSPRLRGDLVVNNLVAYAYTTGEVLMKSDGTPWRPLVHIDDIANAFLTVLQAPRELVYNQPFNVCASSENYQISDVAALVEELIPGSKIRFAKGAGPDPRCYRVSGDKMESVLGFRPQWTVRQGIEQMHDAYTRFGLTTDRLHSSDLMRIQRVRELLNAGVLGSDLRWSQQEVGVDA